MKQSAQHKAAPVRAHHKTPAVSETMKATTTTSSSTPKKPATNGNDEVKTTTSTEDPGKQDANSLVLKAMGVQILALHAIILAGFLEVVTAAAKCGLLLIAAKELIKGGIIKSGGFDGWFEEMKFGFSRVTRCKYMRLAECVCEEAKCKPSLLLTVHPGADGQPPTFVFDEPRLRTVLTDVTQARSLSQLYLDWQIVRKPDATRQDEASSPNKPEDTSPPDNDDDPSADDVVDHWMAILKKVPQVFPHLHAEERTLILSELQQLLSRLAAYQESASHQSENQVRG